MKPQALFVGIDQEVQNMRQETLKLRIGPTQRMSPVLSSLLTANWCQERIRIYGLRRLSSLQTNGGMTRCRAVELSRSWQRPESGVKDTYIHTVVVWVHLEHVHNHLVS